MSEQVTIRKFTVADIKNKVKWVNDPLNNKYLHYTLPLEYEKTMRWFESVKDDKTRYDCVIEYGGVSVGLIGLLNIDEQNKKAEVYVVLGEHDYKGKGVANRAGIKLLDHAFAVLGLEKICSYMEVDNVASQKCWKRMGFVQEGLLRSDIIYNGKKVDRYAYACFKEHHQDRK